MFYRGTIRLANVHHSRLTRILAGHRAAIGSRWRRLPPDAHALLVLAHLRNGDTYQRLADGFDIGVATVYRYIQEALALFAALAPSLTAALWRLAWSGHENAILDGTCIPIDRLGGKLNRLYYCGKHHRHTVNLQALIDPGGNLRWISPGLPGSTHDLTAARSHGVITLAHAADLALYADKGYQGASGTVYTPVKGRHLIPALRRLNRRHAKRRSPGERGFATLKTWKIFTKIRCSPSSVGQLAQAVLALHLGLPE